MRISGADAARITAEYADVPAVVRYAVTEASALPAGVIRHNHHQFWCLIRYFSI